MYDMLETYKVRFIDFNLFDPLTVIFELNSDTKVNIRALTIGGNEAFKDVFNVPKK